MKTLCVIPARGGSKGIKKKNIKELAGKPLIYYSIDIARAFFQDSDICVTSDDDEIIDTVKSAGLSVPFKRPAELSGDSAGTYETLLHAINYYEEKGVYYDTLMLLQPTSPIRQKNDLKNMIDLYRNQADMVVSVGVSHHNPYFNLFEEDSTGYLQKSKPGNLKTRQECPPVYFYNGSVYLINVASLKQKPISQFEKVCKYVMDEIHSVDIDTPLDWLVCEEIIKAELSNK